MASSRYLNLMMMEWNLPWGCSMFISSISPCSDRTLATCCVRRVSQAVWLSFFLRTFLLNGWFSETKQMDRFTLAGSHRIRLPLMDVLGASFNACLPSCTVYRGTWKMINGSLPDILHKLVFVYLILDKCIRSLQPVFENFDTHDLAPFLKMFIDACL